MLVKRNNAYIMYVVFRTRSRQLSIFLNFTPRKILHISANMDRADMQCPNKAE